MKQVDVDKSKTRRRLLPDTRRTIATGVLAIIALIVGSIFGKLQPSASATEKIITILSALVFLGASIIAVRGLGTMFVRRSEAYIGVSHAGVIRLIIAVIGYPIVGITTLGLLSVDLGQLLVGGALTGVVLGIAAQQSLGNLFAGLVLLISRPFAVGDAIVVYSGSLGGPHRGRILEMGVVYVVLDSETGIIRLPNSAVLSAGVGPQPKRKPTANEELELGPQHIDPKPRP